MTRRQIRPRDQQESTAQQLRSFNEVARVESFTAAAANLGLSVPTVWQQVKRLEQEFGETLLLRVGRGVCLTDAGRQLADLSRPLVSGIADLKDRFNELWRKRVVRIDIAVSPRIFLEDLPPCVEAFREKHPDVFLAIGERLPAQISSFVATRQADLGFVVACDDRAFEAKGKLVYEPIYPLEIRLVMPKKHPLAKKTGIRLTALAGLPFFSSLNPKEIPGSRELLANAGLLRAPIVAKVYFSETVRRYVLQENGVGLVLASTSRPADPDLIETPLTEFFGTPLVFSVRRKGTDNASVREFVELMRAAHSHPTSRSKKTH